jgi:hypothetical protein
MAGVARFDQGLINVVAFSAAECDGPRTAGVGDEFAGGCDRGAQDRLMARRALRPPCSVAGNEALFSLGCR